jgi:hypothetical protein
VERNAWRCPVTRPANILGTALLADSGSKMIGLPTFHLWYRILTSPLHIILEFGDGIEMER